MEPPHRVHVAASLRWNVAAGPVVPMIIYLFAEFLFYVLFVPLGCFLSFSVVVHWARCLLLVQFLFLYASRAHEAIAMNIIQSSSILQSSNCAFMLNDHAAYKYHPSLQFICCLNLESTPIHIS